MCCVVLCERYLYTESQFTDTLRQRMADRCVVSAALTGLVGRRARTRWPLVVNCTAHYHQSGQIGIKAHKWSLTDVFAILSINSIKRCKPLHSLVTSSYVNTTHCPSITIHHCRCPHTHWQCQTLTLMHTSLKSLSHSPSSDSLSIFPSLLPSPFIPSCLADSHSKSLSIQIVPESTQSDVVKMGGEVSVYH